MSSLHSRKCDICNIVYREQYLILEHFTAVHPEVITKANYSNCEVITTANYGNYSCVYTICCLDL